jgi:hypothetical protein
MKLFSCLIICLALHTSIGLAQTCCTGGVPHIAGLRVPMVKKGEIGINFNFIYNNNGDLLFDDNHIDGSSSYRNVSSLLLQGDYGVSDRFSMSLILPYIVQTEVIDFNSNSQSYENNGIGDISLWGTYRSVSTGRIFYTVSMGLKVPSGATNKKDENTQFPLPFSFQNGTGSFDIGLITYTRYSIDKSRLYNLVGMVAVRLNTKGDQFKAHPEYLFGHMMQGSLLFNRPFIVSSSIVDINLGANYQYRMQDRFEGGFKNTNTGGHWVNAVIGGSVAVDPQLLISFNAMLPAWRSVNGLQLTTTWMGNIGIGYVFN